jgi:hypothetical protein
MKIRRDAIHRVVVYAINLPLIHRVVAYAINLPWIHRVVAYAINLPWIHRGAVGVIFVGFDWEVFLMWIHE